MVHQEGALLQPDVCMAGTKEASTSHVNSKNTLGLEIARYDGMIRRYGKEKRRRCVPLAQQPGEKYLCLYGVWIGGWVGR
jgi:hypothetical protein